MQKRPDGRMFNAEFVARSIREAVEFGRVWPEIKPPIQELAVPEDKSKA